MVRMLVILLGKVSPRSSGLQQLRSSEKSWEVESLPV